MGPISTSGKRLCITFVLQGALVLCIAPMTACNNQSGPQMPQTSSDNDIIVESASSQVVGEVPEALLDSVITKVIESDQVDREDIIVDRAESVIWPDGSLGCAQPGVMYTQAPVDGYWIVLRAGDRRFDFRASSKGEIKRCNYSNRLQPPVG